MNHPLRLRPGRRCAALLLATPAAFAQDGDAPRNAEPFGNAASAPAPVAPAALEPVEITGTRPAAMPVEVPTTLERITGEQIQRSINATDAEDALKYLPSLSVRKRYIGDHDHAVLASRASGTGNSARSLVYADGMLLSNLLGNGANFTPRWGLVAPEEIERVDVLYGPYSAAYPGNSAGAIVEFVTRMPQAFEAHVNLQAQTQPYRLYATDARYSGAEGSAAIGSRAGDWSWWLNFGRLSSDAQPINIVVKPRAATTSAEGTPVTGAVAVRDTREQPAYALGTTGQTHTVQDHAKVKLAWDFAPGWRASYTLAGWRNDAERTAESYLRDASGRPVGSAAQPVAVNIDGRRYDIAPTDFAANRPAAFHLAQGLDVKSHRDGTWDWEAAASRYDERSDTVRSQFPTADAADAGRLADQGGTGWTTLALKGIWRPEGASGAHIAEFGLQRDAFTLQSRVDATAEWTAGDPAQRVSAFAGKTTLTSLWLQDAWRFAPRWRVVLGGRLERWQAQDGSLSDATGTRRFADRAETHVSPKAAISWQASDDWRLYAAAGRAVRMPTVSELFQGTLVAGEIVNNDPTLKPERVVSAELGVEREVGAGRWRATVFAEHTRDALYSQVNAAAGGTVATVQNVGAVHTLGVETVWQDRNVASGLGVDGLDLDASVTYADSRIRRNDALPASVGQRQPRVPEWRATALASWRANDRWTASLGLRYSGRQYGQLDNSDVNGEAYGGFSDYLVADLRVRWRIDARWTASAGIDNLGAERYWAFHPYPQRTFHAELRWDL